MKTKSPKSRNLEMDATIIHLADETHHPGSISNIMDQSQLNSAKELPQVKTRYMTPIGQYTHVSPKARLVMICAAGATFAIMLAIIVILASLLGARSGQSKVTIHSGIIETPAGSNSTAVDLSKYDKAL